MSTTKAIPPAQTNRDKTHEEYPSGNPSQLTGATVVQRNAAFIHEHYSPLGMEVMPVKYRGKEPVLQKWQKRDLDSGLLSEHFARPCNLGVRLGKDGLVDIDLDCREAVMLAPYFLPPTNFIYGRRSNPESHYFYFVDSAMKTRHYKDASGKMLCEIRSQGAQSVVPPSMHPDNESYEFVSNSEVAKVTSEKLGEAVDRLAAAVIIVKNYPSKGGRNDLTLVLGALCLRAGLTRPEAENFITSVAKVAGDEEAEQRRLSVRYSAQRIAASLATTGIPTLAKIIGERPSELVVKFLGVSTGRFIDSQCKELSPDFDRSLNNKLRATRKNAAMLLEDQAWIGILAFDQRQGRVVFKQQPPSGAVKALPHAVNDVDITNIGLWMSRNQGPDIRASTLNEVIEVHAHRAPFDPVEDYLLTCQWDGVPRLDKMLHVYFGAEDNRYTCMAGSKWMISAVARALAPGCKVDHMLIIEGKQASGKSTGIRKLAGETWHAGDPPSFKEPERLKEYIQGPWICELGELDALNKADENAIKTLLTTSVDRLRLPYARRSIDHPRRVVFVGSTNEREYLRDATGNRRFWPVSCGHVACDRIEEDRDQLWGETVSRYQKGEPWHPVTQEEQSLAAVEQEKRRELDPWQEAIDRYLAQQHSEERFTLSGLMSNGLDISVRHQNQGDKRRVVRIMRGKGWEYRQGRDAEGRRERHFTRLNP